MRRKIYFADIDFSYIFAGMMTKELIIQKLQLLPHPEGGYYRETYRSSEEIGAPWLPKNYRGKRNCSTCIYFLLSSDTFSAFHRIRQDEIWHCYDGSPLWIHEIDRDGKYCKTLIGRNIADGQIPQYIVPAGNWFAATVYNPDDYALVGCTVSPGFDFLDFELASRGDLIKAFPQHIEIIAQLTRI